MEHRADVQASTTTLTIDDATTAELDLNYGTTGEGWLYAMVAAQAFIRWPSLSGGH